MNDEVLYLMQGRRIGKTHLVKRHPVLNKESYPRVEITDVTLEDKVLLRLGRDA